MGRPKRTDHAIVITTNQSERDVNLRSRVLLLSEAFGISISELGRASLEAITENPKLIKSYIRQRKRGPQSSKAREWSRQGYLSPERCAWDFA